MSFLTFTDPLQLKRRVTGISFQSTSSAEKQAFYKTNKETHVLRLQTEMYLLNVHLNVT